MRMFFSTNGVYENMFKKAEIENVNSVNSGETKYQPAFENNLVRCSLPLGCFRVIFYRNN